MCFIKKAMSFSKTLIYWYLQNKRNLPWRNTTNPYYIWLSEIILQQTRIDQGMPYYLKFIEAFPTVKDLAVAEEEKVLKLWQGLGYYSRARNLHFSAKYIVNELKGVFPSTYKELLLLKGVGDYTASAVASICFNEPMAAVDGNVYRVLARYFGILTPINTSEGIKEFKLLAQELIDLNQPGNYNQAVMEFGATVCKPQNPNCENCPLANSCVALSSKQIHLLPVKLRKTKIKKRYFNYLVVKSANNKTILQQRKDGIWKSLYEFPLIETNCEISEKELINSNTFNLLFTNTQVTVKLLTPKEIIHKLSHQHIYTKFWEVQTANSTRFSIPWSAVKTYPVSTLMDNFLKQYKTN